MASGRSPTAGSVRDLSLAHPVELVGELLADGVGVSVGVGHDVERGQEGRACLLEFLDPFDQFLVTPVVVLRGHVSTGRWGEHISSGGCPGPGHRERRDGQTGFVSGATSDSMDHALGRRRLLRTITVGAAVGLAGCSTSSPNAGGQSERATGEPTRTTDASTATTAETTAVDASPADVPDAVGLDTLATGLGAPLDVVFTPDGTRYVADQAGRILVHDADGLRDQPALDIRDAITTGGEKGLLGIEPHPAFAENGRLFVRYSAPSREGTPSSFSHTFVLSEFDVEDDRVDPDSERTLLEIPQPQSNHNAGDLAFGPDGFLYVAVGDGGAGGDQGRGHADDWYDAVGGGNGQDVTENLLGSILRIDVDAGDEPYAIPDDNPLVDREGLDEQYAWGFRNPWRLSFDGTDLFVADVGQRDYEEVSLVERGGNYGWNVREGAHCFQASDCPTTTPDDVRGGERLVDPVIEYPHGGASVSGISVIGGAVYRGSALAGAEGVYVFGDFQVRGQLFAATPADEGLWPTTTVELVGDGSDRLRTLRSFGRDADGELYVVGTGSEGGALHRLVPA